MIDVSTSIVERLIPDFAARMEQIRTRERLPGLAVGIVGDQELIWWGGFGAANLEAACTPGRQTLFRIASITKTFTATAILQLRDEGRLSLDDPLHRHLPEFSKACARAGTLEQVTLRRLLAHHSGLSTEPPFPVWDEIKFPTREALLAAIPRIEIVLPKDTAFKYSNLAFGLLGEVVARVSGLPYAQYLRSQILEPLGMFSTVLELTDELKPRLAVGYCPRAFDDDLEVAPYVSLGGMAACGQLHSSVEDLARWIALQFRVDGAPRSGPQVLARETIAESHRPQYLEPDWSIGYCLGWRATRAGDHVYHGHGGGLHGFASYLLFSKTQKLGVICLANVWPHSGLLACATEIAETLLQGGWTAPQADRGEGPAHTPPAFDQLLGLYEATPGIFAAIAYRQGRLLLEKSPLSDYLLHAPAILEPTDDPAAFLVRGGRGAGERAVFRLAADARAPSFSLGGCVYRKVVGRMHDRTAL
ncbi:MAG TPA: serine hydrolase domain-containing protein [Planctomycetaceae bacterium]|nr:serine hydrolase domain-containing protein [Planctomycetaceae bacterium]